MNNSRERIVYQCLACNNVFFSLSEVAYHKAMSGHREFKEERREATNSDN